MSFIIKLCNAMLIRYIKDKNGHLEKMAQNKHFYIIFA